MYKALQTCFSDFSNPNHIEYLNLIKPVWVSFMHVYYAQYLFTDLGKAKEALTCLRVMEPFFKEGGEKFQALPMNP